MTVLPRSLRGRLTLVFALLAFLGVGVFATALALFVDHVVWGPLDASLFEEAETLSALADLPQARLAEAVRDLGSETTLGPGKFVRVAGADGRTVALSRPVPRSVANERPRRITEARIKTVGHGEHVYRVVWVPTRVGGWVVLGIGAAHQTRVVTRTRAFIALAALGLVALLGVLAWGITSRATTDLVRLAGELTTIEAGSLDRRLPRGSTTEVDRVVTVLNRMLERLQRAVGHLERFTADAAHELRTPVAALRAHLEVTLARAQTAQAYRDGLLDALEQAERLGRLSEDLLTLSTVVSAGTPARVERIRLDDIVREAADSIEPVAEEQARPFEWAVDGPIVVRGDSPLLKRVVLNLIDNAFRHTPATAAVRLSAEREGGSAKIAVVDHGPGIGPHDLPHVFERFRRGQSEAPGCGLGLALAQEIVTGHGGRLTLDSTPGTGTTATVWLPLADDGGAA